MAHEPDALAQVAPDHPNPPPPLDLVRLSITAFLDPEVGLGDLSSYLAMSTVDVHPLGALIPAGVGAMEDGLGFEVTLTVPDKPDPPARSAVAERLEAPEPVEAVTRLLNVAAHHRHPDVKGSGEARVYSGVGSCRKDTCSSTADDRQGVSDATDPPHNTEYRQAGVSL
jgi:hypothetical protein